MHILSCRNGYTRGDAAGWGMPKTCRAVSVRGIAANQEDTMLAHMKITSLAWWIWAVLAGLMMWSLHGADARARSGYGARGPAGDRLPPGLSQREAFPDPVADSLCAMDGREPRATAVYYVLDSGGGYDGARVDRILRDGALAAPAVLEQTGASDMATDRDNRFSSANSGVGGEWITIVIAGEHRFREDELSEAWQCASRVSRSRYSIK